MNFFDPPDEASFRNEARHWIAANAPNDLLPILRNVTFGDSVLETPAMIAASKAWQKKKQESGWACIHWPKEYGGRNASPIEHLIWQEEEGLYGLLGKIVMSG